MPTLLHTALPGLPAPKIGKVREVYDLGDKLLIVATDRLSAFDVILASGIPGKGQILNQMSAFWFERLGHVCPNHIISTDFDTIQAALPTPHPELRGRTTLAKKAKPLPIECVARGYITGSLFKEYKSSGSNIHGFDLPEGLVDSSRLEEPLFTPATKAEQGDHDQNISWQGAVDRVGLEAATLVRDWTLQLYSEARKHAEACGVILADTKFEFGETDEGIILIDEVLTPDSSRYWDAAKYAPGHSQDSFDKQFVRDYLIANDLKEKEGVVLPDDIIEKTLNKYKDAYLRIVGKEIKLA